MIISIIVAMDEKGGIGLNGRLPWHIKSDLVRFKKNTMGHHLVMGRKTYESIGKALPGRKTIIVTRNLNYQVDNCIIARSREEAIAFARANGDEEVFVIGGSEIFSEVIDQVDVIYLTRVHAQTITDTFFPHFKFDEWKIIDQAEHPQDENNEFPRRFISYQEGINRIRKNPFETMGGCKLHC